MHRRPNAGPIMRWVPGLEFVIALLILAVFAVGAEAQDASGPAPAPPSALITISAGYERHRDRLRYEFENPSSIDTPFPVPHRFAQTYVADNQWFVCAARYPLFGDVMETEVGFAPEKPTTGSDLDTFFDPNGDVVVAGTDGAVSMHALRFAHWSEGRLWNVAVHVGYVYRRDVTEFHSTERIVSHSSPLSSSRTPIQSHETTISQVHEVPIGLNRQVAIAGRWLLTAGVDLSPIAVARLTTVLPEKYPGQNIVFQAKVAAFGARAQLAWQRTRWPITLTAGYGHTWSYQSASRFRRDALQVGVQLGFASAGAARTGP